MVHNYQNRSPIIEGVQDVLMQPVQVEVMNITISDPEGDDFTFDIDNLPSFVTPSINGNDITLSISPAITDMGFYTSRISALDENDNLSEISFGIDVRQFIILDSILVNMGPANAVQANAPWNNFLTYPGAGSSIQLNDTEGSNTGITIEMVQQWKRAQKYGETTGDNSGVFPDAVLLSYFADKSDYVKEFLLSGLDPARGYNITFFGSRGNIVDDRISEYSIGDRTVSLNVSNNVNNTITIDHVYPDVNDEIIFNVHRPYGTEWKYINALVITSFAEPSFPIAPSNLVAESISRDEIRLTWKDNSSNENGFHVYRSANSNGPWDLVTSLGSEVEEYGVTGLFPDTHYYFRIGAYNTNGTNYSNVVDQSTYLFSALVNFNEADSEGLPWNEFNMVPGNGGETLANIQDTDGNPTGINVSLGDGWTSTFPGGYLDGNVDGVYPDNVLLTFYYALSPNIAELTLSGLNFAHSYDLGFLGNWFDHATTTFQSEDGQVSQEVYRNNTNVSKLYDLTPDANGEININVFGVPSAVLNAMEINISPASGPGAKQNGYVFDTGVKNSLENSNPILAKVYPNPSSDWFSLSFENLKNHKKDLTIKLTDMQGKVVFTEKVPAKDLLKIDIRDFRKGVYALQVLADDFTSTNKVIIK